MQLYVYIEANIHASGQFTQNGKSISDGKWRLSLLFKFENVVLILDTRGRSFVRAQWELGITAALKMHTVKYQNLA